MTHINEVSHPTNLLPPPTLATAVGPDEIRRAAFEDYKDWLCWTSEPIRPYVVVRLLACVYQRIQLPDERSCRSEKTPAPHGNGQAGMALEPSRCPFSEEALVGESAGAFASDLARERKMRAWLVLSRRVSVDFDAEGRKGGRIKATSEMPCEPFLVIGGRRVQFDFDGRVGLRPIDGAET